MATNGSSKSLLLLLLLFFLLPKSSLVWHFLLLLSWLGWRLLGSLLKILQLVGKSYRAGSFRLLLSIWRLCSWWYEWLINRGIGVPVLLEDDVVVVLRHVVLQAIVLAEEADQLWTWSIVG